MNKHNYIVPINDEEERRMQVNSDLGQIFLSMHFEHWQMPWLLNQLVKKEFVKYIYWFDEAYGLIEEDYGYIPMGDNILMQIGEHCPIIFRKECTYRMWINGKTLHLYQVEEN